MPVLQRGRRRRFTAARVTAARVTAAREESYSLLGAQQFQPPSEPTLLPSSEEAHLT